MSRKASIPGGTSAAISAAFSFEIGPGPLGIGETSPTADAPGLDRHPDLVDRLHAADLHAGVCGRLHPRPDNLACGGWSASASSAGRARAPGPPTAEATAELARLLVSEGIGVVYGGGRVGLMGALADAVLARGRRDHGRDPALAREPGDRPPRRDGHARRRLDARAQGDDGRAVRRLRGAARRHRDARGAVRGLHLGPARPAREALRAPERRGLLRRRGGLPRPRGRASASCARRHASCCSWTRTRARSSSG